MESNFSYQNERYNYHGLLPNYEDETKEFIVQYNVNNE